MCADYLDFQYILSTMVPQVKDQASIQGLPPCFLDSNRRPRSMSIKDNTTIGNISTIKQKPDPTWGGLGHVG